MLDRMGVWYGDAERRVWQELDDTNWDVKSVKKLEVTTTDVMTGRQFNSIRTSLDGKKNSRLETLEDQKADIEFSIKQYQAHIQTSQESYGKKFEAKKAHFKVHQFKRKVHALEHKWVVIQQELEADFPSICVGSRKLFYQQFNWAKHGFSSFQQWKRDWQLVRNNHFFCLGYGPESGGNQSCVLTLQAYDHDARVLKGTLRLRLPKCFESKYINVDVQFNYQAQPIYHALVTGQPISYWWIRKDDKWYVHATTNELSIPLVTDHKNGGLGLDFNPMRLALGRILADGNPIACQPLYYDFDGMGGDQRKAILGERVKQGVLIAQRFKVPLIMEQLDFAAKKREWRSAGCNRMLSSFAYKLFYNMLRSTAASLGVQVIDVDPQDTSTMGIVKFAAGYGFSRDEAAALAIARRGLGFSERVSGRLITALPLPVDKGEHVLALWKRWRKLRRNLKLTGNGWQLKVKKVKVKAVNTKGCRCSKLDRSAGLPSLKSPKVIWPRAGFQVTKMPSFRG